jgi:MoxR-like ATPase
MSSTRRRRYGQTHIGARLRQVVELTQRIDGYLGELSSTRADLAAYLAQSLWVDDDFARRAGENLSATVEAVRALRQRAVRTGEGFEALPRLPADSGIAPPPIEHEPLAT